VRTIPTHIPINPHIGSHQLIVVLFVCIPIGSRRDVVQPNRIQNATSLRGWNVAYEPCNCSLPVPNHATSFRPPVDCCFVLFCFDVACRIPPRVVEMSIEMWKSMTLARQNDVAAIGVVCILRP
jgi:hypothetical protein